MSISKAQAEAIAEGFLDTIGSDRAGLVPRKTFTEAITIAAELIETAQKNLIKTNLVASGNLSESLIAGDPTVEGSVFTVDIYMNYYGLFVDRGVKGTRSGSGQYQFRFEIPSKSMVEAIDEWLKEAKISVRTVKKYKGYGINETKKKSLAEYDNAFAFARKIKQVGIKPRRFLTDAINTVTKKVEQRLGIAVKIDIINSLS